MLQAVRFLSLLALLAAFTACGTKTVTPGSGTKSGSSSGSSSTAASSNSTAPSLTLTNPGDKLFPSNYMVQNSPYTFDFNNAATGNDLNMTYTCVFKYTIDGTPAVDNGLGTLEGGTNSAGGWTCADITVNEGGFTFNAATGVINWTPQVAKSWGGYTITVTGTDSVSGASGSSTIYLDIARLWSTAGLVRWYAAEFAHPSLGGEGFNSPFISNITDLMSALGSVTGTLTNFAAAAGSGWNGVVTEDSGDIYRLEFDGVNDYIDFGNQVNGNATLGYDGWFASSSIAHLTAGGRVLAGNGDSSGKGLNLTQSSLVDGQTQAVIGNSSYYDEVVKDAPVGYWHLGETAFGAATDVMGANNGSYNGVTGNYGWSQANGFKSSEKTVRFTSTSSRVNVAHNATLNPTGNKFSIEFWIKFNTAFPAALKDVIQKGDYAGGATYYGIRADNTQMGFLYYDTTFHYNKNVTYASLGMSVGTWYHVAYVVDNTASTAYIYVNGTQITTDTVTADARAANSTSLYIGGSAINGHPDINLSDVAIYNTNISQARLQAHYTASTRPTCLSSQAMTTANSFYTLGAYWNNGTTTLGLYMQSNSVCSYNAGAQTITGSTANFRIGADYNGANAWGGKWSDTRVYNANPAVPLSANNAAY